MKKLLTIIVALLATTGLLAHADMPPETQYRGLAPISVTYQTYDSGHLVMKAIGCGLTFWAFGGYCNEDDMTDGNWNQNESENDGVNTNTTVVVKTWGEGKVLVILSTNEADSCAGFQKTYVGYVTAYDTFNLFPYSPTNTAIDPTKNPPAAILTVLETSQSAQLELFNDITAATQNTSGNECDWTIHHDVALKFSMSGSSSWPSSSSSYGSHQSSDSPYDAPQTRD